MLDPVSVALKFGFLAVLYLFLLWVARSALKDLRRGVAADAAAGARQGPLPPQSGEATGILIHLLGTVSDLLACLPDDKVNEILNNTLLDYWQAEP